MTPDAQIEPWIESDAEWADLLVASIGPVEASKVIYLELVFADELFRWIN